MSHQNPYYSLLCDSSWQANFLNQGSVAPAKHLDAEILFSLFVFQGQDRTKRFMTKQTGNHMYHTIEGHFFTEGCRQHC